MAKRHGTNFADRNAIQQYVEQGITDAARIAANLNLVEGPVQNYVDDLTGKNKPKRGRKPAAKANVPTPAPAPADDDKPDLSATAGE